MKDGIFEIFGDGEIGQKAHDLIRYAPLLESVGIKIPEGFIIPTKIFYWLTGEIDFYKNENLSNMIDSPCPNFLASINEELLDKMTTDTPYAIRSSALSERGGTGIYKTAFFWATGNRPEDSRNLWACELAVYTSEFAEDAKSWRGKNGIPAGMAILIQPVIGFHFENYFLPALAGVAYTSYNGLPTVRAVIGLGTKAVNGGGTIFNYPSDHVTHFQREMWEQEVADALTLSGIGQTHTQYEEIFHEIARGFLAFNSLFEKMATLQKHGDFYLEWAISDGQLFIVQCAAHEDRLHPDLSFNNKDYFLLFKGNDVFNSGRASCKSIVYAKVWSPVISDVLESLNRTIKDYLLIVPQDATSQLAEIYNPGHQLAFRHFSNALAVVEKQRAYTNRQFEMLTMLGQSRADHTSGKGATHFSQLCGQANILFVGGEFDATPLVALSGGIDYRDLNIGVTIWDTDAEILVNTIKKEGYIYISKNVRKTDYSFYHVEKWCDILRRTAYHLEDTGNAEMTSHFYLVHYAIAPTDNPVEFDPFKIDDVAELGGTEAVAKSLRTVIANGERLISGEIWNNGLKTYLEQLLLHITQ